MQASHHHAHYTDRARQGVTIEYSIYFALIFAISLPHAAFRQVFPRRGQERRFFVTEAWSMARRVTPRIFSA